MAAEITYQDGHAKCQGNGCMRLVYAHLANFPHLCMDCAQPIVDKLAALRARLEDGEITSEEHNDLAAKVGTADEEPAPAPASGDDETPAKTRRTNGDTAAAN